MGDPKSYCATIFAFIDKGSLFADRNDVGRIAIPYRSLLTFPIV